MAGKKCSGRIFSGRGGANAEPVGSETRKAKSCGYAHCRAKFVPRRSWQDFCSTRCRKLAWKKDRISPRRLIRIEQRLQFIERKLGIQQGED